MRKTAFIPRAVALIALCALLIMTATSAVFAQEDTFVLDGPITYVVEVADTLDRIGALYDVKVECVAEINEIEDIHTIFPGTELVISPVCPRYGGDDFVRYPREDASPAFGLQAGAGQGGGGDQVWIVGINDTLDTIGQALDVSVISLQIANDLEDGAILRLNQEIIVPADAAPYGQFPALNEVTGDGQGGGGQAGEVYVVQPRDTLDLIALASDAQVACIAEANAIADVNRIFPGQALLIPDDCPPYDGLSTP